MHNRRRPEGEVNDGCWRTACEMEIARTIYDDEDLATIKAPRSRIGKGYRPDSIEDLPPELVLAEDIYEWLLQRREEQIAQALSSLADACACACEEGEHADKGEKPTQSEIVKALIEAKKKLDEEEKQNKAQAVVASTYKQLRNRPPSLTDEVDALLRVRAVRERSYRRPSRRTADGDLLLRGALTVARPPLVEIFVDRSGSFCEEKTRAAETKLRVLLQRYGTSIRHDVWYFSDNQLLAKDPGGGGNTPYHLIAQHLQKSVPKIAIIITDDDPVSEVQKAPDNTTVLCVPVGCNTTQVAQALGGKDVH
jgi:hypothetical protein